MPYPIINHIDLCFLVALILHVYFFNWILLSQASSHTYSAKFYYFKTLDGDVLEKLTRQILVIDLCLISNPQ